MPVVINYKICDLAPECGGIEVCPTGAFFYNKETKRPEVDNKKCISCGLCARECPVEAILVAKTEEEYRKFVEKVKNDPRSEKELWRERLSCQPARTPPLATVVALDNFTREVVKAKGWVALDVWSEDSLDCRYHSVLWSELGVMSEISFKKLDGGRYSELAKTLGVTKFPTLLFFKDGKEVGRREEYIYFGDKQTLIRQIKKLYVPKS